MSEPEADLKRAMRTTQRTVDALRLGTRSEDITAVTAAIEQLAFVATKLVAEIDDLKRRSEELRERR